MEHQIELARRKRDIFSDHELETIILSQNQYTRIKTEVLEEFWIIPTRGGHAIIAYKNPLENIHPADIPITLWPEDPAYIQGNWSTIFKIKVK